MGCNSEEMYQILQREILTLALPPGEFIFENTLCERFGVSRTPVRSVLQRLSLEGLVQIHPYKGTQVALLSFLEIRQYIFMRIAVESMVLREFAPACTPILLEKIRYIIRKQEVLLQEDALAQKYFYQLDSDLHEIWFAQTQNPVLWQMMQKAQVHYTRFRLLDLRQKEHMEEIVQDHQRLLYLLENKQTDQLEGFIKAHLYGGIKRLTPFLLDEYSHYFLEDTATIGQEISRIK